MNAEDALRILSEYGEDAGSDYNDSDEVNGYFGWRVRDGVLEITYEAEFDAETGLASAQKFSWDLR